jgi:alkylation response protein AidB-like acyl-CoA dehydrogenase
LDFSWTDDQLVYRGAVIEFAAKELNNDLVTRDAESRFDMVAWRRCGDFGIQGLPFPVEYGGQGGSASTTVLAMEALGYGSADNGLIFSLNAHLWAGTTPIHRFGTEEQKRRWLPGLCAGSLISGQAMTEPDYGSDAYSLRTTARLDGDRYVLNGSKSFVTNAPIADLLIVFATVDRSKGWAGLCAFVVERDTPGLVIHPSMDKMGLRTSPMAEVTLDDCSVPAENLLGSVGSGMSVFSHSMEWERSCILASAIGTMERQIEACVSYAGERKQFTRPIAEFQAVSHTIVDMKVRLETSRLLLYRLAWLRDQGKGSSLHSSMVKYQLSESFVQSSLDAVQIHGGSGYMRETQLERDVRDALASRIYSGTSEIQKNVMAKYIGL